jgi:hypothetical protein
MEKKLLNENYCNILLNYFDCIELRKVMKNKILPPRNENCLEVYRRLFMCERTNNRLNILRKRMKV